MIENWIPAITTSSLLGGVLWLLRKVIASRITNSIKHEYDKKLARLNTELKKSEASFNAELKDKEYQINALQNGALTSIVSRQEVLYQRKIEAVSQLWEAVISLGTAKAISAQMAVIKFETAAKEAAINPDARKMFSMMGGDVELSNVETKGASLARPFLSPLAWAFFSAYKAILVHAAMRMKALQLGVDQDFADIENITNLIKVALPHQEPFINKHGPEAFHHLLDELEENILAELRLMLQDKEWDKESIERAANILQETDQLIEANSRYYKINSLTKRCSCRAKSGVSGFPLQG